MLRGRRSEPTPSPPDGKALASTGPAQTSFPVGDFAVSLWDLASGNLVRRLPVPLGARVTSLAFSPDGKTLATAGLNRAGVNTPIILWDVTTGKELSRFTEPKGETPVVMSDCRLTFSDGGKTLVWVYWTWGLTGPNPAQVSEWDPTTGRKRRPSRELPFGLDFRAFSPDGKAAAFADKSHVVRVLDLATGEETHRFAGHKGQVLYAAFSSDGKTLATGGLDATLLLWDLTSPARDRAGGASRPAPRR